jgi:hypothetical protein
MVSKSLADACCVPLSTVAAARPAPPLGARGCVSRPWPVVDVEAGRRGVYLVLDAVDGRPCSECT